MKKNTAGCGLLLLAGVLLCPILASAAVNINNIALTPKVILELYNAYSQKKTTIPDISPWIFMLDITSDAPASNLQFTIEFTDGDQKVGDVTFSTTGPIKAGRTVLNASQISTTIQDVSFNEKYISVKDATDILQGQSKLRGNFSLVARPLNVPGRPFRMRYAMFAPPSALNFPPKLVFPKNIEVNSQLPVFSWSPAQKAETYEILLGPDPNPQVNTYWISPRVRETQLVYPLSGRTLDSGRKYYWQVRAYDSFGRPIGGMIGMSEPAWFTVNSTTSVNTAVTPAEADMALRQVIADKELVAKLTDYEPMGIESNCQDLAGLLRQLRDGSAKVIAVELE